jgi:hypothetical protein
LCLLLYLLRLLRLCPGLAGSSPRRVRADRSCLDRAGESTTATAAETAAASAAHMPLAGLPPVAMLPSPSARTAGLVLVVPPAAGAGGSCIAPLYPRPPLLRPLAGCTDAKKAASPGMAGAAATPVETACWARNVAAVVCAGDVWFVAGVVADGVDEGVAEEWGAAAGVVAQEEEEEDGEGVTEAVANALTSTAAVSWMWSNQPLNSCSSY